MPSLVIVLVPDGDEAQIADSTLVRLFTRVSPLVNFQAWAVSKDPFTVAIVTSNSLLPCVSSFDMVSEAGLPSVRLFATLMSAAVELLRVVDDLVVPQMLTKLVGFAATRVLAHVVLQRELHSINL